MKGRRRAPSRQRLPRLCLAKATRGRPGGGGGGKRSPGTPPGEFRAGSFSRRHAAVPFSFSHVRRYTRTPCRLSHRRKIRRPPARCIPMQIILAPGTRRNRRNFMLLRNSTCLSYTLRLYRVRSFSLSWAYLKPLLPYLTPKLDNSPSSIPGAPQYFIDDHERITESRKWFDERCIYSYRGMTDGQHDFMSHF